jgi:PAS domain-containing serine/threonine kinase
MLTKLSRRPSMDLFECIEQHDWLSEDRARFVFAQVAKAVAYLHSRGVVHRDIKDEVCTLFLPLT